MKNKKPKKPLTIEQKINRRTFVSFGTFALLSGAAYGGWAWLKNSPKEMRTVTAGAKAPLRRALNKTELFFRNFFSNNNLVKTYPKHMAAKVVRHNSDIGSAGQPDLQNWKLVVKKQSGEILNITLDDLKSLPKTEIVFDFKCVEGWDQISYWGGVKFTDFIKHFNLEDQTQLAYVGLATPDKKYYVGLDMPSAMHPQTLLAYEVNARPLPPKHGQPLRLIIPVKYGIKNLKRIGSITFSDQRPPDYWAEQGYDYYSGL
ncbi:molybdopterin-dependent oxidoreductase [Mucilaginibacter sp. AK015]|uniref:molybdopterin-dependent oxidoreductase n=1 Tax=Mucilaginibacter sp. AK015 TaxID=2723072 RepID=UPI00161A38B7|nr:molybdopterin-dependent oxidoreductase [Mucilaginibacter sp. AK015]MBB5397325.1 DMSO/TMAO reductase YedYZ molybdopterin-dependent catalytic subunit [Mucilaginibacter sp. AK015]